VNAPPNVCTPTHLAMTAGDIVTAHSDVMSLKVLEKAECEELGMGLYLGACAPSPFLC